MVEETVWVGRTHFRSMNGFFRLLRGVCLLPRLRPSSKSFAAAPTVSDPEVVACVS
jgi:hypothetical protein